MTGPELTLRAVNLFATGLVTGTCVVFQVSVIPIMRSWSEEHSLRLHHDFAAVADPDVFIKPSGAIALLSAIVALIVGHHHGPAAVALTIAGIVAFVIVAVISEAINVPINRWAGKWSGGEVPAGYPTRRARWEAAHLWRTVFAVAGFACYVVGALEAT